MAAKPLIIKEEKREIKAKTKDYSKANISLMRSRLRKGVGVNIKHFEYFKHLCETNSLTKTEAIQIKNHIEEKLKKAITELKETYNNNYKIKKK